MGKIPERWREYTPIGHQVHHSRLIAFKVPLKESIVQSLPPSERFTPATLFHMKPEIGLIIDLTMTNRYYDHKEIVEAGRMYAKIPCPGQRLPGENLVRSFFATIDHYLELHKDDRTLIGIHCTHGVNRTGYMIGRYLMQRMGVPCDQAINAVSEARGHSIERPPYITDLTTKTGSYLPSDTRNSALRKGVESHSKDMRRNWQKPRKDEAVNRPNPNPYPPKDVAKQMSWNSRENIPGPSREFRDRTPGWNRKPSNDLIPPTVREPSYLELPVKHHTEKLHEERSRVMHHGERSRDVHEPRYRFEDPASNFIEISSNDNMYASVPPQPEVRSSETYGAPPGDWPKKDMLEYTTWANYRAAEDINRKIPNELSVNKGRISPEVRRKHREGMDLRQGDPIPVNIRKFQVDNLQRVDLGEEARKYRRREDDYAVCVDSRKADQAKPFLGAREAVPDIRVDRRQAPDAFHAREVVHHQRDEPRFKSERSREQRVLQEDLPQRFPSDRGFPIYEEPCYETEEERPDLPHNEVFSGVNEADFRVHKSRGRFPPKDEYLPRERENFGIQKETEHPRFQDSTFDAIRKREFTHRKEKDDLHLAPDEFNKRKDDFRPIKVKSDLRMEERRSTRDDFEIHHVKDPLSRNVYNPRRDDFKPREDDMWLTPDGMSSSKMDEFRPLKHTDHQHTSVEKGFSALKRRDDLKHERDHLIEEMHFDSRRRANVRDPVIDNEEKIIIDRVVPEHAELQESRREMKRAISQRAAREERRPASPRRHHRGERDVSPRRHRHISPEEFVRDEDYVPPAPHILHERARVSFDLPGASQSPPRRHLSSRGLSSSRSPILHRGHEEIRLSHSGRSRSPIEYHEGTPERIISARRRRSRSPLRDDLSPSRIQDRLREVEEKLRRVEKGEIELSRRRSITPPMIKTVHNERDCRQILNQKRSRKIIREESPPRLNPRMERRRRSPSPFRPRKPVFNRLDRKRI